MLFIHKYTNGKMVSFTKTPQPKHEMTQKFDCVVGDYIRMMKGRVAKIEKIFKKEVDTSKYSDVERLEIIWIYSIKFLDNNEVMEITPNVTMVKVKINHINLFTYRIYIKLLKIFN